MRPGILMQRDFRLFWTGETVNGVGNAMAVVAMPLLAVTVLHVGTYLLGVLTAVTYLPWLLISLPAGALTDRLPARRVMLISDMLAAVLFASLPVTAWLGVLRFWQMLAVAFVTGSASVFFTTSLQIYLRHLVDADSLVDANAKLQVSASAAYLSGPGISGAVVAAAGAAAVLLGNAISFLVSAGCLLGIRPGHGRPEPSSAPRRKTRLTQDIQHGIRVVFRDPYLRAITCWAAMSNLGLAGYDALTVVFLVRVVHIQAAAVGLLMTAIGAGGITGAAVATSAIRRFGSAGALILGATVLEPFVLLIPLTGRGPRLALFVAGVFLSLCGIAIGNVVLASFRQAYAPADMLGAITATMRFAVMGGYPLGGLAGGLLGTWLGIRNALWIALTTVALAGTWLLAKPLRNRRDLPAGGPLQERTGQDAASDPHANASLA